MMIENENSSMKFSAAWTVPHIDMDMVECPDKCIHGDMDREVNQTEAAG